MKQNNNESVEWYTPPDILDRVRSIAPIGLDPCSSGKDLVNARISYTKEFDGLSVPWSCFPDELIFVNPPYGRGIRKWLAACEDASDRGHLVIGSLPSRTGTPWFQDHILEAPNTFVCWIRGRLRFSGSSSPGKFDSVIVMWGDSSRRQQLKFKAAFGDLGYIY